MPDIDPAALSKPDPVQTAAPASLSLKTTNTVAPITTTKASKAVNNAQRIDIEPLYANLKSAIGDNWGKYKEALSEFALGHLNQNELSFQIDYFICADPQVEHLHNQFIAAIYSNVCRDPPEPGVAPWVSSNDKPIVAPKPVTGDAAEQRLKTEVKQLPAKDRRRLKAIPERDRTEESVASARNEYRSTRNIKIPDAVAASAGGLNKTNWDLEIRKRYNQPLAIETGEFPDADTIQSRMIPICYEEALPSGCSSSCAEFMAAATEQFMKEVVGSVLSKTRSNIVAGGVGGSVILTSKYKRQFNRELAAFEDGKIHRAPITNMLPIEAKETSSRRTLAIGDFRMAMEIDGCNLGQMPDIAQTVTGGYQEGVLEGWGKHTYENGTDIAKDPHLPATMVNGTLTNGTHVNGPSSKENGDISGWQGGGGDDRNELFSLLDEVLTIGRS